MTKPKVYLAVAGAGKTYTICNSLNLSKRNLILSYTNENIFNIFKEMSNAFSKTPENTSVMTFDSFVLHFFIWPYLKKIEKEFFYKKPSSEKMISLIRLSFNSNFISQSSKTNYYHYFIENKVGNRSLILSNCADLIMSDLKFTNGKTLFEIGIERINKFYDCVYIDEFQDYRKCNFELICKIMKNVKEGYLYGDYYQHSVSGQNNTGIPFLKNMSYEKFKRDLKKNGFDIDETSLNKTRRCSENICEFVRSELGIIIYSDRTMDRTGKIQFIYDECLLKNIIKEKKPKIIVNNKSVLSTGISYGLSKGNTYRDILVVLSDSSIDKSKINIKKDISDITKNKLYVAITRATGNVYLTNKETLLKSI